MPLSDLGETPTQEVVHSPTDPGMTLPDASEHKEFLEVAMRDYEAQRANRATSNRRTNILVAATPSNSGESSRTPQREDDFSFHNRSPEFPGQESRFEFNGSSSFDKMLDRDLADAPDPTPDSTQPQGIEPVQVDGFVEPSPRKDILTTPPLSSKQRSPPFEWIAPTPSAAVASSNPRSLLRMVHPGNQYRIAKMRILAGAVEPPSFVTMHAETQPSRMEETQPYHVDESTCLNALLPVRPAPPQTTMVGPRQTIHPPQKEDEDDEAEDVLDVVPDSEPLRAEPSTQTPGHRRVMRQSPHKKAFRPVSPVSEHGSGDLVPDSLEVEESEADIPLAIEVASRNTKKPVVPAENVAVHGRKTGTASSTVPSEVICATPSMTMRLS